MAEAGQFDRAAAKAGRKLLGQELRRLGGRAWLPVVLGLAVAGAGIAQAWLLASLVAGLLGLGTGGWPELIGAAALALLAAALVSAQEIAQGAAGRAARAGLRARVFAALLAAGPADGRAAGEKASLAVEQVEALDGYFSRWLPAALLALMVPAGIIVAVWVFDWVSGLVLLVMGMLVPVFMAVAGIGAARASRRQFDALARLSGRFTDRIRGLSTLVQFNRAEDEAVALGAAAEELRTRTMRVLRVAFLSSGGLELLAAGTLAYLAWRHGSLLGHNHPDAVTALWCILVVPAFFQPLRNFSAAYHEAQSARGAAAALAPLLADAAPQGLALEKVPPLVALSCADVKLNYAAGRPPALDGLSFSLPAGETLLLAGASGSGKSSLLALLLGFRRPDAGRIAINGQDITRLRPAELRRMVAHVGQRPHIFAGTIAENIAFARPEAGRAAIEAAAEAAQVLAFTDHLPLGLDTPVGEGGHGLSGGQAQRVGLARAFLREAPLVLLDEPTASLDPGTEGIVLEAIRKLCMGRTAIVATHSAAALRGLPGRVLVLENGRASGRRAAAGE
ncbi:thiol reductant ABC exporter subunit CydD [Rhodovarius crocodyli]|uniref:Thiol reductant ABC exporter subunit CydD n=1 Tax=Rhodovarius crocodyli TaxID=1979269 RepID=A0A437MMW2_9PROT|nr:thiol reductant ABC exporter subunit CydD [Rhodovarius crocodyli]